MKEKVLNYILLTTGVVLSAYAITAILRVNNLVTGGITGISIILEEITPLPFGLIYYLLSIVVLILTYLFLGKHELYKILFLSLFFPLVLILFEHLGYEFIKGDIFLATIYYGVIAGAGSGLIIRSGYTSGGSDTIAKIMYRKFVPFMSIGQILLIIDGLIVIASVLVFDFEIALYAIITKFVSIKTIDLVVFGIGTRRVKVEIISRAPQEIIDYIINDIKRGVSIFELKGGYKGGRYKQLVTICSPRESIKIKNKIAKIDEHAFVYVIALSSVWGGGFLSINRDDLA
ncbi:YitT family protein [Haloplasma contractile]|uniref:Transporter protein n=1 Tax=Haloplasma contractile SSD-17B TaxID=1033810 RepID=U2DRB5_9MOLU|nr:YitT family protein [Haloplasma contractile]ERJ11117.1 Transporter protein [Haloplasma contractile SSD-17B]